MKPGLNAIDPHSTDLSAREILSLLTGLDLAPIGADAAVIVGAGDQPARRCASYAAAIDALREAAPDTPVVAILLGRAAGTVDFLREAAGIVKALGLRAVIAPVGEADIASAGLDTVCVVAHPTRPPGAWALDDGLYLVESTHAAAWVDGDAERDYAIAMHAAPTLAHAGRYGLARGLLLVAEHLARRYGTESKVLLARSAVMRLGLCGIEPNADGYTLEGLAPDVLRVARQIAAMVALVGAIGEARRTLQ